VSATDDLLARNEGYADGFRLGHLPRRPALPVAIVACIDARLDPARALGFSEGDANVIRNAGGAVTDDALRSLAVSQRLLGTREIVLLQHTDCGMLNFDEPGFRDTLELETGERPAWPAVTIADVDEYLREATRTVRDCPFLPHTESVRGFVYDVRTGRLREAQTGPSGNA
jgi:carbonic anhydrase